MWLEWKGPFVLAVKFLHVLQGWDERKDVWQKMRLLGIDESECPGWCSSLAGPKDIVFHSGEDHGPGSPEFKPLSFTL